MDDYLASLWASIVNNLPSILLAIGVIVIGLIVAYLVSGLVRSALRRTNIDERLARTLSGGGDSTQAPNIKIEDWVGGFTFWLIVFFTVIAALQILNLNAVSGPLADLLNPILAFIPNLISALILLAVAWLIATVLRIVVTRVLSASGIMRSASENAQINPQNRITLSQTIGNVVYWLVFLLFLPAILGALNLQGILGPVQTMVNNILSYLPNILGAALIFIVGYLIARIVRGIVVNLLSSTGVDNIGRRAGMGETADRVSISNVIGWIVYVLILIPTAIAALNALNIPAVSEPASNMLNSILTALPNIFAAFVVLAIAYFIGRLLGNFVAALLEGVGFNRFFRAIGLQQVDDAVRRTGREAYEAGRSTYVEATGRPTGTPAPGSRVTPSKVIGYLVTVGVILFAALEAANLLGFEFLAVLISDFIESAFQVLVGLAIFALGLYLSSLAYRAIRDADFSQAYILAPVARVAIIVFAGALALRQMGIAESIVNLAFGLLLGAVAVAAALAFGLGGRDVAREQLERWQDTINSGALLPSTGRSPEESNPPPAPGTQTPPPNPDQPLEPPL